jgi:hypothetical protein
MIKPILLYNSEIWGSGIINLDKLLSNGTDKTKLYYQGSFEKVHLRWCKYILGVNSKSCNIAVTAELGRYPLLNDIYVNMFKYWSRVKNMDKDSLAYDSYITNVNMIEKGQECWLTSIHKLLNHCNMTNLILNERININMSTSSENTAPAINKDKALAKIVKHKLNDTFDNHFQADMFNDTRNIEGGNKLRTYRTFKHKIHMEKYLTVINDKNLRKNISRLRISALNLHIETGRHRCPRKTPINERLCESCESGEIGDEIHTIIACEKFEIHSEKFINLSPQNKFKHIMGSVNDQIITNLALYLKEIIIIRGAF